MRNKALRSIACFAVLVFVNVLFNTYSYAEEVGAYEGYNRCYRWKWTYINSSGTVTKCRVKVNGDNLFNSYQPILSSAVNHWNSLDSIFGPEKDKVYCYLVDWDNSKLDFFTAGSGSWFYGDAFSDAQAITLYKNSDGIWSRNPNTGVSGSFLSGMISYARCAQTSWVKDDGISTIGIALQEEVPSHL